MICDSCEYRQWDGNETYCTRGHKMPCSGQCADYVPIEPPFSLHDAEEAQAGDEWIVEDIEIPF